MFDSSRFIPLKLIIFSTITFALIILVIICTDNTLLNVSLDSDAFEHASIHHYQHRQVLVLKSADSVDHRRLRAFKASYMETSFDSEITDFFSRNQCKLHIFMTWISPAESFGEREFFGLESLFKTNPTSCLIILSTTMDSREGDMILKPLIELGFHVRSIYPNMCSLFKNTPAEDWFGSIKNGSKDPGDIPLPQNLSNLIRLAVLYKFGGVYLDTDFIILKDLSSLRNSIGAQSVDVNGNWTRLNNAVLVFDKKHPLVYKFIEEFALTFDGNRWGHNGPYLVSRVVDRVAKRRELFNFTILPPMAFYPVDWTRISGLLARPNDRASEKWAEAKARQLSESTYGVHLWNRQSSRLKIEEGSVVKRLISDLCVVCNKHVSTL